MKSNERDNPEREIERRTGNKTAPVPSFTLIDADASGVDWHETYRQEFGLKSAQNDQAAYRQYLAHLKRAQWMAATGYAQLP